MRMIDADALLKRMQNDPLFDLVERYGVSGVINAEPTVDAVPVIRCKDCYFHIDGYCDNNVIYQMMSGDLIGVHFEPHEDFYCAMAERKEK